MKRNLTVLFNTLLLISALIAPASAYAQKDSTYGIIQSSADTVKNTVYSWKNHRNNEIFSNEKNKFTLSGYASSAISATEITDKGSESLKSGDNSMFIKFGTLLAGNIAIAGISVAVLYNGKKRYRTAAAGQRIYLTPAQAGAFLRGYNQAPDLITATIADFERRGFITIERRDFQGKKSIRDNYIFRKLNKPENLTESDRYLYDLLFGDKDEFSTESINAMRKENGYEFNSLFSKYIEILSRELESTGVQKRIKAVSLAGVLLFMAEIPFAVLSAASIANGEYRSIINIILSIAIFYISIKIIGVDSPLAKEQKKYYRELCSELENNETEKLKALSSEEKHKMAEYAIAFGFDSGKVSEIAKTSEVNEEIFEDGYFKGLKNRINYCLVGNEKGVTGFTANMGTGSADKD